MGFLDTIIACSPCLLCHKSAQSKTLFCQTCQSKLPWHPQPIQYTASGLIITPLRYAQPIAGFLKQLKFYEKLAYSRAFGNLLGQFIKRIDRPLPQVIIPVPLHRQKLRERGFNQSLELCRFLQPILNIDVNITCVSRHKYTQPQAQLPSHARYRNTHQAFTVHDLPARHIAVVDDILTSGHTATELCQALLQQGAQQVDIWCCASARTYNH